MSTFRSLSVAVVLAAIASQSRAENQSQTEFVNQFGNAVFPSLNIGSVDGIPSIFNDRGTGSDCPPDGIGVRAPLDLEGVLDGLIRRLNDVEAEGAEDEETLEEIEANVGVLDDLLREKFGTDRDPPRSRSGRLVSVNPGPNVAGAAAAAAVALGELNEIGFLNDDDLSLSLTVVADADPFVILSGSITNTSTTQPLNIFLPFEQAFLDPIALDAPLLRETFISTELRDTDGDGDASLRAAGLEFQILATTDSENPSLANTDPIGVSERLGLPRLRNPGVEFFLTDEAAPVDNSLFVSQRAQISHATGQLVLEDLSPGDTVDFTAILSLGIEGDPLTPLIPTESLRSFVLGAELVANATVPEPSSAVLMIGVLASMSATRRRSCRAIAR